jgi:hypothetical protein
LLSAVTSVGATPPGTIEQLPAEDAIDAWHG